MTTDTRDTIHPEAEALFARYVEDGKLRKLFSEVLFQRDEAREQIKAYAVWALDVKRLTRAIDVAMHGEDGAAEQASLCDLVAPASTLKAQLEQAREALERLVGNVGALVECEDDDAVIVLDFAPDGAPNCDFVVCDVADLRIAADTLKAIGEK